jgi:hypothetical protein
VNGEVVREPGHKVRVGQDLVEFDSKPVDLAPATVAPLPRSGTAARLPAPGKPAAAAR